MQTSSTSTSANVSLSVSYSNVDWDFLKRIYGWAASQYQAWARGELIVHGDKTQHVVLHTDAILEYWIDGVHYFGGDYYSFRKAPPVLHLAPGSHKIDLRLVRDVRAFGGILEPSIDVVVEVQQASGTLELAKPGILLPDIIDGKFASQLGSVYLRNSGQDDIEILEIRASVGRSPSSFQGLGQGHQEAVGGELLTIINHSSASNETGVIIVAGQTRSVAFNITLPSHTDSSATYNIFYKTRDIVSQNRSSLQVSQDLKHVSRYEPHKFTFLHPGGMLSYAMIRPPAKNATCRQDKKSLPVLLALHGAGVEADDPMLTTALDPVSDLCAWVLFPTGVTTWSGDDWHTWGFADVEAAVEAIPTWIEHNSWKGPEVDIRRWIVSGHSNGGQGAWYALTHRPDLVLAAAPVSGYASIQKYVSYELWQPADPRRTAIVSSSLNNYRHEMLMANVRGIPIQQQHGDQDDNVPAYHSRFLAQQLYFAGVNSSYNEVAGQKHWWDRVMTTEELVDFYYTHTTGDQVLPRKLDEFTLVVGDPGSMGPKSGIKVTHLIDPGQYGRVDVKKHTIHTSNVQSLELEPTMWQGSVSIDGQDLDFVQDSTEPNAIIRLHNIHQAWTSGDDMGDGARFRRYERQMGSMTAILRTRGPFVIRHPGFANTSHIALQISRNMHQYFQADSIILQPFGNRKLLNTTGNIITVAIGNKVPDFLPPFPIRVGNPTVAIRDHLGRDRQFDEAARGAALLRPAGGHRLELLIWGADDEGLRQAARIAPMLTGVGQPDFVVLGECAKWRGIEGALAMGFFDSKWEVTASSVIETS